MGMKAICEALRPRKREDYKNLNRKLMIELQEAKAETARIRRKLENVERYVREALS